MQSRILVLSPPFDGMSAMVNVIDKVGPEETNNSDDVKVVQRLIQMAAKGPFATSVGVPQVTGNFDAATGFWIFRVQDGVKRHGHPHQVVDGFISPARGSAYGAGAVWTIVIFNKFAKLHSPTDYAAFLAKGGVV